ncbi:MAG: hypothetical protein IPK82_01725 [Polyangiaceae bacterium]|nr:hypothetical protein [Polyangiaceae bacterium]
MSLFTTLKLSAAAVFLFGTFGLTVGCMAPPAQGNVGGSGGGDAWEDTQEESVGEADDALLITCGAAGLECCAGGVCQVGLRCNANNICRKPCGMLGEKCCSGTCSEGVCNPSTLTCIRQSTTTGSSTSSGGGGCQSDFDCPLNTICQGGSCVQQGVGCNSSADCLGGQFCVGGSCCFTDSNLNVVCPFQP